jgi:hypothetical protein
MNYLSDPIDLLYRNKMDNKTLYQMRLNILEKKKLEKEEIFHRYAKETFPPPSKFTEVLLLFMQSEYYINRITTFGWCIYKYDYLTKPKMIDLDLSSELIKLHYYWDHNDVINHINTYLKSISDDKIQYEYFADSIYFKISATFN